MLKFKEFIFKYTWALSNLKTIYCFQDIEWFKVWKNSILAAHYIDICNKRWLLILTIPWFNTLIEPGMGLVISASYSHS